MPTMPILSLMPLKLKLMLSPHRNTINGENGDDDGEDEAARRTSDLEKKISIKLMLGFSELI